MAARVLAAQADPAQLDDKDYYGNKRLELAGQLLGLLFEDLFKRLNAELRRAADTGLSRANRAGAFDVLKCIRTDTITNGLEHALASGNWTVKRFRMDRKGVTQVLSRLSFISALGMMTRINSQFEKTRKVSGPRALQPSQWGMLCPSDTPEGEACGLVKNLALMTHVTTDEEEEPLRRLAFALGTEPLPLLAGAQLGAPGAALVFLNGHVLGAHRWPARFAERLRALRRAGRLGEFVSVHTVAGRCYIASDGGRVCRPLIIVRDGVPAVTDAHLAALRAKTLAFVDFIERGLVEYLDVNEENDSLIALTPAHVTRSTTHLEIEPFTILGVVAGLIPYPHHNQSPRNTYQCAMGKQAMGAVAFNQNIRMDTLLYLLVYPQKPLVTTKTIQLIKYDRLGAGQNATVAVMSYSGYDIEDALVVNAAALDRGFGRCTVLRKHGVVVKKYANRAADRIVGPPRSSVAATAGGAVPRERRSLLDADGVVAVGQLIQPGDVYVNKESPVNTRDPAPADASSADFRPAPAIYRGEPAVVDRVLLTTSDEGQMLVKVWRVAFCSAFEV
jgi:DNA-directed RNA polymerase III subunit RPC2